MNNVSPLVNSGRLVSKPIFVTGHRTAHSLAWALAKRQRPAQGSTIGLRAAEQSQPADAVQDSSELVAEKPMTFKYEWPLSRSDSGPLLDLLLFAQEMVDFGLQRLNAILLPVRRCLSVFHKSVESASLAAPRPWRVPLELTAHCAAPFCFSSRTELSIGVSNGLEKSRVPFLVLHCRLPSPRRCRGRSSSREPVETIRKLQNGFSCAGIGQLPATSRACSARSSHSKASSKIDTIWSSLQYRAQFPAATSARE